jgi:hypothetical protein
MSLGEAAGVGLALVAQDVVLVHDHEGGRQAGQIAQGCA